MILESILLASAFLGGVALAIYWEEMRAWINRVIAKLPVSIKQDLQGAIAFIERIGDSFKNIMNYYSHNVRTQKWTETVVSTIVDVNQVPDHIKRQLNSSSKVDITAELQSKLEMVI